VQYFPGRVVTLFNGMGSLASDSRSFGELGAVVATRSLCSLNMLLV
jgi:hypothetical protein